MQQVLKDTLGLLLGRPLTVVAAFFVVLALGLMPVFVPAHLRIHGVVDVLLFLVVVTALVWHLLGLSGPGWLTRLPRVALSIGLTALILGFLAILAVFASAMASLAIMAGAGYDFSAEDQAAAMTAFQQTPGWQLCLVCFGLAGLFFVAAALRSLPVLAASLHESRVVALEAFMWTRGYLKTLIPAAFVLLGIPVVLIIHSRLSSAATAPYLYSVGLAFAVVIWCALSVAAFKLTRPEPSNIPQPS